MSYKPDESTLTAYLYDELDGKEKSRVEEYLSENEAAQQELREMKETLSIIKKIPDREVNVPSFTFTDSAKIVVGGNNHSWLKVPLAIAASLALLMVVGYLTSFRFSVENQGVQLSFGAPANEIDGTFTKSQVEELVAVALDRDNKQIAGELDEAKKDLVAYVQTRKDEIDEDLLNKYLARLRQYNAEALEGIIENSELEQKKYTDQVIQDFAIFLDLQRQDDLDAIQTRLETLSEETIRFNNQTGQILTNLLSTENTQNNNQY